MAELIDIYDGNGNLIGAADRVVAHAFGLWHKTIHCWIICEGKLVFQRRSLKLSDNPGKLYTTASGHIKSGESLRQAFEREVSQEIGIMVDDPKYLGEGPWVCDVKKSDGTYMFDKAFVNSFFAEYKGGLEDFKFNDGEVDSITAIDLAKFAEWSRKADGQIDGIEWNGKILSDVKLDDSDFLINPGETIYNKYGRPAERIKQETLVKNK
ncbi:MAG: NUDIX domain-containing protein [Rickettsiales bacterium]|jgi:isopentenyldiphosphate isomerase|nr:NUDIX domain-containing protein [Rickettsiales bacterium]